MKEVEGQQAGKDSLKEKPWPLGAMQTEDGLYL